MVHKWNWGNPITKTLQEAKDLIPIGTWFIVGKQKVQKKPSYSFQIQVRFSKMDMVDVLNSKDEGMVIPHQNSDVT